MKTTLKLIAAAITATALAGCASAPEPSPQHYSGVLLYWFEGQSFRAEGETETWAFGMSPEAMQVVANAYPEGYQPSGSHTVIAVDVEGELQPVDPAVHRYGCVGGCYNHYLTISHVIRARLLRGACQTISARVYFASNAAALDAAATAIVDGAVSEVRREACNVSRVSVVGHTDTVGAAARNLELSRNRATAVGDALATRGIDAALISAEGAGEERLPNQAADNVAEPTSRYVEITIEAPTAETP
ncbi:MAG: OmpA family protein [Hyphomonadaceae bacterium]|nr:OmpA family protein [Hyphomonadaceae bacterium]